MSTILFPSDGQMTSFTKVPKAFTAPIDITSQSIEHASTAMIPAIGVRLLVENAMAKRQSDRTVTAVSDKAVAAFLVGLIIAFGSFVICLLSDSGAPAIFMPIGFILAAFGAMAIERRVAR